MISRKWLTMFSDPLSVLVALIVILCIAAVGILVINQNQKKRVLLAQQNIPEELPAKKYSLLVILTKTTNTGIVSEQGYGVFSYQREDLYDALEPVRALVSTSKDDSVVKPLMNVISYATARRSGYQFFKKNPNFEVDDVVPVCVAHNRVLVLVNNKITPCADSIGVRKNLGISTGDLIDPSRRRTTVPLASSDSFFVLRQRLISDERWDLLE